MFLNSIRIFLAKGVKLGGVSWTYYEKISPIDNNYSICSFTKQEIKEVVFDKSPGPDDFPMVFYQTYWHIIKSDLLLFEDFYNNNLDISKLNRASICLIHKVHNASLVTEYRPIALLNCNYKIGSDDFPMVFYQTYWHIIKSDLLLFEDFYNNNLDISKLNRASICLIHKVHNASLVTEYRPIALLNCNYKIGSDDFPMVFYQTYWHIIKSDLLLFEDFYNNNLDISKLNRASICLIHKVQNASLVTEYRPIALLNCNYKIFSKVLADKLQSVLSKLINPSQSVFLKDRNILDSVATAHEIICSVHFSKEGGVLVKIDFQRALDFDNWQYIMESFRQKGFSEKWVSWIAELLWGSRINIVVNGVSTYYFECKRGVRQGDPLSPYLLILAADGLNKMIEQGTHKKHLMGLGPKIRNNHTLINLQYADATLLFSQS